MILSSLEPKNHMMYCRHFVSSVVHEHFMFQSFSQKPGYQIASNLAARANCDSWLPVPCIWNFI